MKTSILYIFLFLPTVLFAQPTITVQPLTNLTSTQVTFNAIVNANGISTTVRVYWDTVNPLSGSNKSGTSPGSTQSPIIGNSNTSVARTIPSSGLGGGGAVSLTPNTTYYYYFEGTYNTNQTVTTAVQSFTTPSLNSPASVSAENLTNSGFTLQWSSVTEKTYIQRSTSGFPTGTSNGINVFNAVGTSLIQSGLTAGTTYYFRIWSASTNNVGTIYSAASKYFAVTTTGGSSVTVAVPASITADFDLSGYGTKHSFSTTGSTTGNLTITKYSTRPENGYDLPENGYSLRGLTALNEIAPVFWTITNSGLTNYNYDIYLDYSEVPDVADDSSLVVVRRDNSASMWTSPVNNSTVLLSKPSGSFLKVAGLTVFSEFGFASDNSINSLPVELSSFTFSDGKLFWSTKSEFNNTGWEIERSQNPLNPPLIKGETPEKSNDITPPFSKRDGGFSKIGFVAGNGTTTESQSYSFTVNSSELKFQYYQFRLKQIDTDGNSSYSNILTVKLKPNIFSLSQNYPNPFNPNTVISYQLSATSHVKLVVFDLLGRDVEILVNEGKPAGNYSVDFSAKNLPSGIYFYKLTTGNFTETKKMTVLK